MLLRLAFEKVREKKSCTKVFKGLNLCCVLCVTIEKDIDKHIYHTNFIKLDFVLKIFF